MEQKTPNLNTKKVEDLTTVIKKLEAESEFVTLQIIKLQEGGIKDKTLFDYLNNKKSEAIAEIARLKGERI